MFRVHRLILWAGAIVYGVQLSAYGLALRFARLRELGLAPWKLSELFENLSCFERSV